MVVVLPLIGLKRGASFLNQSCNEEMQQQLLFDIQMKTSQCTTYNLPLFYVYIAKNSVQRKKAVTLVEIAEIMEDLEGGWEELATALQFGEENLHKIRKENKTNREKAYAVLTMWTNEKGEDATIGRLLDTIVKIAKRSPGKNMLGM